MSTEAETRHPTRRVAARAVDPPRRLRRTSATSCCASSSPALVGMIDGTVSSLAPIFAAAVASSSHTALLVGSRHRPRRGRQHGLVGGAVGHRRADGSRLGVVRGAITGGMTTLGGIFHTLPFLISDVNKALVVAGVVVAVELFAIAWMRKRFLGSRCAPRCSS